MLNSLISDTDSPRRLSERIATCDVIAEREIWMRYAPGLRFLVRRQTGDDELAQDVVQETFQIALMQLREGRLENPDALSGFLRGIALKVMLRMRRAAGKEKPVGDGSLNEHDVADERQSPFARTLQNERRLLVRRVIEELPVARDRQMLWRYYVTEDDKDVICKQLELSVDHFDRVLHRARSRFAVLLSDLRTASADIIDES
ncbi:MAG: sigma-70 family RNA polymerase sigma factor [Dokdonella sp.]